MCFINRGSNIVWCNEAYSDLVGVDASALIGSVPLFIAPTRTNSEMLMDLWGELMDGRTWFGQLTEKVGQSDELHLDAVITPLTTVHRGKPALFFVMVHDVTKHQQAYKEMHYLANHDRLTGLVNRGLFSSMVENAIAHGKRHGERAAVLFIDLDGFKQANDTFGHEAGDHVLVEVAGLLRSTVRESDVVSRLGGDEFACLLTSVGETENAYFVADKIIESLRAPIMKDGNAIKIGASIGISIFPDDGTAYKRLISCADSAMYDAKRSGKNCWRRYMAGLPTSDEMETDYV
jgi:diguanylate cyclase (GGDEF)-like protein/PAS domain S-box-containing protein